MIQNLKVFLMSIDFWTDVIPFTLPDLDVFEIDASAAEPKIVQSFAHIGTVLFNMVVSPKSGKVLVLNGEANNMVRFEGDGIHGGSTVRGNLHRYRITSIEPRTSKSEAPLNPHIDYSLSPKQTEDKSIEANPSPLHWG